MKNFPNVEEYLSEATRWHDEIVEIRGVLLRCGLDEAVKWGKPCYGHKGANIAIVQPMKNFLALLFVKGALLDDPKGLLQEQGKNTRSARRLCFTSVKEVRKSRAAIRDLVRSAIGVEDQGKKLPPRPPLELVEELRQRLDSDPDLKAAFENLTPGRQREYHLYISGAKQATTRSARVEKHVRRILSGKGLRDR